MRQLSNVASAIVKRTIALSRIILIILLVVSVVSIVVLGSFLGGIALGVQGAQVLVSGVVIALFTLIYGLALYQ